ncbi:MULTISPECIES: hypothetical protein [unclassified Vibrio]|uniref:hypothetical protein n=1 Tax=unclassified Vibrio TaxID=2614977 RepID=UPI001267D2B9|nr:MULTISPECIES: hypothetical protein [unclassified Vibrio]QFT40084.1 hypothetical protein FIU99_27210 [Vibrio sp. THAF64]QGM38029.1 hypothetical protein GGC04_27415 [Vibrio sp. THAF191d]QGN73512.1 hypothetical protein GGC03_27365 [Vibrio sp. THAF191c]
MENVIHESAATFWQQYQSAIVVGMLPMFVVTHNTLDFGDKYVARLLTILAGQTMHTPHIVLADTLEGIREYAPSSCTPLPRDPRDSAVIVETWL